MNLQRLFPSVGKVIANTGNRNFPRVLHDLIVAQLPVDATHITELRLDATNAAQSITSSIGGVGISPICTDTLMNASSVKQPALPNEEGLWPAPQTELACCQRASSLHTSPNHLHLIYRTKSRCYALSVYRSNPSQGFSQQECVFLQEFSCLLLPMIGEHIEALMPAPIRQEAFSISQELENGGMDALRQRFIERLEMSGLNLSSRETEVCVGLLAGRTAPELAEQLALRVNTVESYLKRASIKMGIGGRRSLIRWMHSADARTGQENTAILQNAL
ncbi:helix-turn-helix transcriptional regulator [Pseudomonas gingeri]|uniref:Helix-turn-helix transcriptional regulator n=1 Tax=Pseudomonas gingeri TaxID=117681 RepID=A0A7Y7XCH8_9PSED|nr:helix-turn-helix transcriptional regulator [Pseudomonas gingeri]NWB96223.1 helix-turn-helix transcriptional regulator [Pseudomonas gingeri]NWD72020.1 helix-turn-helix transcriptional regulator [Pseudomonas gingeri]NWD75274.1 helix-turn-helix transcriptional regulator [Pseudomonas gingeri]